MQQEAIDIGTLTLVGCDHSTNNSPAQEAMTKYTIEKVRFMQPILLLKPYLTFYQDIAMHIKKTVRPPYILNQNNNNS